LDPNSLTEEQLAEFRIWTSICSKKRHQQINYTSIIFNAALCQLATLPYRTCLAQRVTTCCSVLNEYIWHLATAAAAKRRVMTVLRPDINHRVGFGFLLLFFDSDSAAAAAVSNEVDKSLFLA
jgi:hypothetical protein